jgi:radical SAM superfamily enzyme YgiQ (UPF0313 family)
MTTEPCRNILLLSPPGNHIYLRDYYCSHTSKARYYWGPFDLLVVSGILSEAGCFRLQAIDAMLERLSPEETERRVLAAEPDAIVFLTGAVSFTEDFALLERIAQASPRKIRMIGLGDCMLAESQRFLEQYPFLDAALLDFTSRDLVEYLRGERAPLNNLSFRLSDGSLSLGPRHCERGEFSLPLPAYDLFDFKAYRIPHGRRMPFAGVLTDYGCAFRCDYCIGGELGFRLRNLDNLFEELRELKRRGVRELWIKDLTFGAKKSRTYELLDRMRRERLGFSWVCLSRVNVLDEDLLCAMKAAGCHTIQIGVESASEEILEKYAKGIHPDQVRRVVEMCRRLGIRILAHYILGLPGDTVESIHRTLQYAIELNTEFASFNVAMPRLGTQFRQRALESGLISADLKTLDNSISQPVYETSELPRERLWALRNEAIRAYHLRPAYIIKRLTGVRSWYEFTTLFREGFSLLASTLK